MEIIKCVAFMNLARFVPALGNFSRTLNFIERDGLEMESLGDVDV